MSYAVPEVSCDESNDNDVLMHAVLLQRLGFDSLRIRSLLADHPALGKVPEFCTKE
jgi:hypothetical protein